MARQYTDRLRKKDVVWFGEKTPEHTGHLPRIRQLFPDAKVLVLCRDGRDVALSLSKMPWAAPDLYVNFLVWLYCSRVARQAHANPSPTLCFARYEDIVAAPEKELGRILQFLELPYEPAVAEGCGNREGIPPREYPWKAGALEKIAADRVHVFRRELDGARLAVLERLGRDALPALGYPLLTDGKAPLSLAFLLSLSCAAARFLCRLPWPALANELFGACLFRGLGDQEAAASLLPTFA
jgi:hypothetical protein